jgi:galactonate dehydratase
VKITAIDTYVLSNRRAFVKISTDEGVAGWGEPVLENWARSAAAAVARMAEHLVGADPLRITWLWQTLARGGFYRGGPVISSAVSGLDQALWDIKGRWLGVPVHELLGGPTRDSARVYAHSNTGARTGDLELAAKHTSAGITMLKVSPPGPISFMESPQYLDTMLGQLWELRRQVGANVDICIDLHGRFSLAMSRILLSQLEPLSIAFVEEPTRPEYSDRLASLVRCSAVPIATGERLYSRYDFHNVLESGVPIVQPDVSHAGGITECFRIATQAEIYDAYIAPHCAVGPIALAASLQIAFAVPNFLIQEHTIGADDYSLLKNPEALEPVRGEVRRLTGPGLGVDVNEAAVQERVATGPLGPGSPVWTLRDGSFAEW